MKKRGIFFAFLLIVILSAFLAAAANQTEADVKGYACLEDKVTDKCSTLTTEEKIFSLLSIERCKTELVAESLADECWPDVDCSVKTTAQAILALRHVNTDTLTAENWLLSQTGNFPDIEWFLQVEADNQTTCTVSYSGNTYSFRTNEDKTLTANQGTCFSLYKNYWLKIAPACYDYQFEISCKNSFLTSLLYKKKTSETLYVSQKTSSASGEGKTTEKVSASCFKDGNSCDYEGSLWASIVLKSRGYDVSSYIPYLVAMSEDNLRLLPESFLYTLTNNFKVELLAKQQEGKWWLTSGDKFYDTAVALLPFQGTQLSEKTSSKTWLAEVQGEDGCWQGNVRNTAFLLYSVWPKKTANVTTAKDCESFGYGCMSSAACLDVGGNVLTDYTGCFGNICCSKKEALKTCSEQNGELCDSDESCLGGSSVSASDTSGGRSCCISGICGVQEKSECETQGGFCKSLCSDEEEFAIYSCVSGNCCVTKQKSNLWLIVLLVVLILLAILGIIFRKKLRSFFFKLKSKFGKGKKPAVGSPRFPPTSSQRAYPGAVQRRIIPAQQSRTPVRKPVPQKKSEFDDVLKKLKEIGK